MYNVNSDTGYQLCRKSGEVTKKQTLGLPKIKHLYDELTVSNIFYNSPVYALREQEDTKLWHFSPLTLFLMFDEEQKTVNFEIPEEA